MSWWDTLGEVGIGKALKQSLFYFFIFLLMAIALVGLNIL